MNICLSLLALFLFGIPQGGTVSGKILDREGKPLAGALVTYTHTGQYTNAPGGRISDSGTGKVYKTKTNKKGEFQMTGVGVGIYQIVITDAAGARVYSTKKIVGDNADADISNVLNVDLSHETPPAVREQNAHVSKINKLILNLHTAIDAQDWPQATDLLQQLIALDANRWEFYQNLGTIQSNRQQYQEAAESYQKGVELAQKALAASPDSSQVKSDISSMMVSEADALHRLGKLDEATALYNQAAALAPQPAMAYFHACNAQSNRGSLNVAIDLCNKAITADPGQWEFYQVLASSQNGAGKPEDAVATYEKGIQAAKQQLASKPDSALAKNGLGQMLNAEGNLYAQHNQYDQAIAAFTESAKVSAYAAMPWYNVCATYYNMNRLAETIAACDQAIASDPTLSDAYFLKASALFGEGRLESGKYAPPPETRAALNKYLELSPFGSHAQLVREMLDKLDTPVDTAYKPAKPAKK